MVQRCVLIGGSGFLGAQVAHALSSSGYEVIIVDKAPLSDFTCLNPTRNLISYHFDYRISEKLEPVLKKGDILFHFACSSLPSLPDDRIEEDLNENVSESVKLFKLAMRKGIKRIIFPSSGGTVYGNASSFPLKEIAPTNPICSYGITKLAIEKYLILLNKLYGLNYLIFRIGNAYGPGQKISGEQGLIAIALSKVLGGFPVTIFGDGSIVRDYVYIDDIVEAFLLSLENGIENDIFNIGTGKGHSIREVIGLIQAVFGIRPKITYSAKRPNDVQANILDSGKLNSILGWSPKVSIEDGISKTGEWVRGVIG